MKYDIVFGKTLRELIEAVNSRTAMGWEPQGSPLQVKMEDGSLVWQQAIVLDPETE